MSKKLKELALYGEVVGAVAIVISLVYLAIQVNDSTRAIRSAATNDAATAMQSWYLTVGSDEQTAQVFFRGMRNPDSLSREELFQFIMITHAAFLGFQNSFQLAQQGTLEAEIRESITNTMLATKDLPGFRLYWEQRGPLFNTEFRQFIEANMRREPSVASEVYTGTAGE